MCQSLQSDGACAETENKNDGQSVRDGGMVRKGRSEGGRETREKGVEDALNASVGAAVVELCGSHKQLELCVAIQSAAHSTPVRLATF